MTTKTAFKSMEDFLYEHRYRCSSSLRKQIENKEQLSGLAYKAGVEEGDYIDYLQYRRFNQLHKAYVENRLAILREQNGQASMLMRILLRLSPSTAERIIAVAAKRAAHDAFINELTSEIGALAFLLWTDNHFALSQAVPHQLNSLS